MNYVLITGASGLLGRSLVRSFVNGGYFVFAHYYKNRGKEYDNCRWLNGDFSTILSIRSFLEKNSFELMNCTALVNNYGPITYKKVRELKSSDLNSDFHGNLITSKEIIDNLLEYGNLRSVVNVGYEGVGKIKPFKNILSYAIAKAGSQLLTLSYEREYSNVNFSMVSPLSLKGGEFISGKIVEPDNVAERIFEKIISGDAIVQDH